MQGIVEGAHSQRAAERADRLKQRSRHSGSSMVSQGGLRVVRRFTTAGEDPFSLFEWEARSALIAGDDGRVIFEQTDVEVPTAWSQLATNVVVSKYFRGAPGTDERENSVRQLVSRVVRQIGEWAEVDAYFASAEDLAAFTDELKYILTGQLASFNSPVWFNVGVEEQPQCSACFINSVEDNMESILELAKTEGMLFRYGSGTGSNLSPLRASTEHIRGGGTASGPVSFMRGYDSFAGVIKSGGKTRRAAKMVILDCDHPDIEDFIGCKTHEEKKAWSLIDAGYDGSVGGEAYDSVFFQNANHSVRASDEFMLAVENDGDWQTRRRTDGEVDSKMKARDLMAKIADNAHRTGDPGMQFDTTINAWHTCKATDRIYASNPCSEYMFLNDSACNLASLNLMKFRQSDGEIDVESLSHVVDIVLTAQETLVDRASYPTTRIRENSINYRPLGLGYANLGALLMARGLPYDSEDGRAYAAAVTALMGGRAYMQSARIAAVKGTFAGFKHNAQSMLGVIAMHGAEVEKIDGRSVPDNLMAASREVWGKALELGGEHGFRNAQATVLAPTGTIGFMMDCDTTGIEPDISLIKYKKLVGGGTMKIVNQTVPLALRNLGYNEEQRREILGFLDEQETIEGAPHLRNEDLPVFDCAFKPAAGERTIAPMGHVRMMAATQPFLSGAISKTVNIANDATTDDIAAIYAEAWKLGLKAIAIYRDGCKRVQPLNTSKEAAAGAKVATEVAPSAVTVKAAAMPSRRRLPDERQAVTHKFSIAGHEGYITVGLHANGSPGEVFITMSKEGSTISGLMDSFATAISLALQYGVPLEVLCDKFSHTRYEPSGFTGNPEIPMAKSITDYLFRWISLRFGDGAQTAAAALSENALNKQRPSPVVNAVSKFQSDDVGLGNDGKVEGGSDSTQARSNSVVGFVPPAIAAPDEAVGTSSLHAATATAAHERAVYSAQADAPSCADCGTIMIRSGSCYKCVNCGSTSGCS